MDSEEAVEKKSGSKKRFVVLLALLLLLLGVVKVVGFGSSGGSSFTKEFEIFVRVKSGSVTSCDMKPGEFAYSSETEVVIKDDNKKEMDRARLGKGIFAEHSPDSYYVKNCTWKVAVTVNKKLPFYYLTVGSDEEQEVPWEALVRGLGITDEGM